ncbi:MAG: MBL fold metallo-hydrolase, partial [Thermomicrobiales bacterium]
MSEYFICKTCGAQFAATDEPPERCPICDEERQYIGHAGQQWTTLAAMQAGEYHNVIKPVAPGMTGIGTQPSFAIGQRAVLIQTAAGNVLWDCISLLDDPTIATVKALGGIAAIAISHPHFYSSMVEWSRAFDAPIYLHADDQQWVMRPDSSIVFWSGETQPLVEGVTAIRCGGHFAGSAVLHWAAGADGAGA